MIDGLLFPVPFFRLSLSVDLLLVIHRFDLI